MTDGRTPIDHNRIDFARFYPHMMSEDYIAARCTEAAQKIYNPAVHPREPYATGRNLRRSPFYEREKELGGHFMELGGWERAHGYAANEHLLEKYGDRVPVRANEWDNRHFWRVSNAEHLAMTDDCGIVNLSHFHMVDIEGPDHACVSYGALPGPPKHDDPPSRLDLPHHVRRTGRRALRPRRRRLPGPLRRPHPQAPIAGRPFDSGRGRH
jgi:hypothetical protein